MRHKLHLSAAVAIALVGATSSAFAQTAGIAMGAHGGSTTTGSTTTNPGSVGISSAPGGASTTTTGMGTGPDTGINPGLYRPGVSNPSSGATGTGASPGGLPDYDPAHPGFPGRDGQ
jgi:hypothetical protein